MFRKRLPGETPGDDSWLTSRKQDINGWEVSVNDYFTDTRPDRVLGTLTAKKGRFGGEVAVEGDVNTPDLGDVLAGIVEEAQEKGLTVSERTDPLPALLSRRLGRYEGNIAREDDGTYTIAASGAAEPFTVPNKPADRAEFDALLGIRDSLMTLLDAEATDDPAMDDLRVTLNERYDAYVAAYGPLNRFTTPPTGPASGAPIPRLFSSNDPKGAVVNALEAYTPPNREIPGDTGSASKASIFTTRGVAPREPQTSTDNPADALTLSMDRFGYVRLDAIAEMLGTTEEPTPARSWATSSTRTRRSPTTNSPRPPPPTPGCVTTPTSTPPTSGSVSSRCASPGPSSRPRSTCPATSARSWRPRRSPPHRTRSTARTSRA